MVSKIGPKTIFLSIFTLLLFLLLWTSSSKVGLEDSSLVAQWHMDEGTGTTVSDSSGNDNTGTIYGATWVDGKFGKALSFDGTDDYVEVANSASLNITGNEITMEAWVYGNFPVNYKRYIIINKYRRSVGGYGLIIYHHSSPSGTARAYLNTDAGRSESFCGSAVSPNIWTHIAFTWNSPSGSMYINGVKESDCELNGSIASYSDRALWIGKPGGGSGADVYFNGTIDEIAIYNRALSASEIQQHYEEGLGEEDTTPPTVSVSHTPSSPTPTDSVTITATASDNVGVTSISIYVDSSLAKTCSSSPCSTTSQTYSIGTYTYYATASDAANNTGRNPSSGTKSFTVQEEEVTPVCGNNIKETGEECDGTDDSLCPGECLSDCTCYVAPPPTGADKTKFRGAVILSAPGGSSTESADAPRGTTEDWIAQAKYIGLDAIATGGEGWIKDDTHLQMMKTAFQKYRDAGLLTVMLWNSHGAANYNLRFNPPLHYWSMDNQHKQIVNFWRVYIDSETKYGTAYKHGYQQVSHCLEYGRFHKCEASTTDLDITEDQNGDLIVKIRNMEHYRPVYGPGVTFNISSVYEKYPASEFSWLYDETGVSYDPSSTMRAQKESGSRLNYGTNYELFIENNSLYAKIYNPNGRKLDLYVLMYYPGFPSVFLSEGRQYYLDIYRMFLSNFTGYIDAHLQNDGGFPTHPRSGDFRPEMIRHVETKYNVDFNFDNWIISYRASYDWDLKHLTQYVFDREAYLIFKDYAKEKQELANEYGIIYVPTTSDMWAMTPAMYEHIDSLLINVWDNWQYRGARWGKGGTATGWTSSDVGLAVWEAQMIHNYTSRDRIMKWTKNAADNLLKWNPDGGAIYYWQVTDNKWNITDRLDVFKEATQYFHDRLKHVRMLPKNVERHTVAKVYPLSYGYRYGTDNEKNPGQIDSHLIHVKDLKWDSVPTDGCLIPTGSHVPGNGNIDDTQAVEKIRQAVNNGANIAFPAVFLRRVVTHYQNIGTSIPDVYKNMFQAQGWTYTQSPNYLSHYLTFDGELDPRYLNGSTVGKHWINLKSNASVNVIAGESPYAGLYETNYGAGKVIGFSEEHNPRRTTYFTDAMSATYGDEYLTRFYEYCTDNVGSFRLWDVGKTYLYKADSTTYYALLVERHNIAREVPVIVYGVNYSRITDMDTGEVLNTTVYLEANSSKLLRIDLSPEEGPPLCTEDWTCTAWSDCVDGTQTRTCTDNNVCGTTINKPLESQACEVVCVEDWTCGEWSKCVDGTQARTCTDNNACGTAKDKPSGYQECEMCIESWLCTEWTECIDSTQARVCTDNNVCGTIELKPHESQACEEVPTPTPEEPTQGATPTGPSGVMGSASAGGGVSSRVITPTIAYEEEITYEFRNHPIYEVTFITLVDISNSKVSVEDLGSIRPIRANVIPDGLIYRYVDLITSNIEEENTDSIKIRLKVPILFYIENDIDPRRTKLQRWTGSDWDVLNTSQIGSDDTYYYFRTLSDSLSLFAITAELTGISSPSTTCNKFCEEGEVLNIDSCECIPLAVTPGGIMLDYETFTYIVTFVSAFIIVLILHRVYRKYRGRGEIEKVMEKA